MTPVHRVGQKPAEQEQHQHRSAAGQPQEAEFKRRVGQLVDLPGHCDRGELAPH